MTDRELLEFAAKAAGYPLEDETFGLLDWWNPLDDDGDALRLAVKLSLELRYIDNSNLRIEPNRVMLHNVAGIVETVNNDPCKATRRVIVRAAAEIGRNIL